MIFIRDIEFLRIDGPKDNLINLAIQIEWDMFSRVSNIGGRASCQDTPSTFYIMRYSQLHAWDSSIIQSWLSDLQIARREGRNLIELKYAYMMEITSPAYFNHYLRQAVPSVSDVVRNAANEITDYTVWCEAKLAEQFPYLLQHGRPISSANDSGNSVSVETYLRCEIYTYSEKTARLLLQYIRSCRDSSQNYLADTYDMTVSFYGYRDVFSAEAALRRYHEEGGEWHEIQL